MGIKCTVLLFVSLAFNAQARPVSYSGGLTWMAMSDQQKDSFYYHYSPSYQYSLGVEYINDKLSDRTLAYFRSTQLLHRKNTKHSQRNFYSQFGLSSEGFDRFFYGLRGDWETRRWFTAFDIKREHVNNVKDTDQSYKLGIAPYLGDYGDLHTWLMLKGRKPFLSNQWSVYPTLRLFKGDALMEVGCDGNKNWEFHFMYRI